MSALCFFFRDSPKPRKGFRLPSFVHGKLHSAKTPTRLSIPRGRFAVPVARQGLVYSVIVTTELSSIVASICVTVKPCPVTEPSVLSQMITVSPSTATV